MPVRNGPSVPKRWSMASASCAPPRQPCPSDSWATSAPRCAPTSKLLDCPNAEAATRVASATAAARDRIRPPMTLVSGGLELVLLRRCRRLTLRLAQQPGGAQPDGVGHVLVGHAAADQGVFLVDVQLQAPGHGQPVPGPPSHLLGLGFGFGGERAQGAARPASWGGVVADQGQAGRGRGGGGGGGGRGGGGGGGGAPPPASPARRRSTRPAPW